MTTGAAPTKAPQHSAKTLPHGAHVLLVRLSALGDVLFALETVSALAHARPDVRIDFLVEDRFASLLQGHPQIAHLHVFPRKTKWRIPQCLWRLRQTRYDAVLDLHGIQKSALPVMLTKSARKIGYAAPGSREGSAFAYTERVPVPTPLPHRADMGYLLLERLGIRAPRTKPMLPAVEPPARLFHGLPRPLVLLHPGTSAFAEFKRWPVERFAQLAKRLADRGIGVAVSYGPSEQPLAKPILDAEPRARAIDGAALSLRGLAGAMRHVDCVVAADTGPLHIATAMGAHCVALFGPKDTSRYGPRSFDAIGHEVLFFDVPCRPCTLRDCVSPQCVLGLTVDRVEQAVLRLLQRKRA
ncbi:MAG: lipopolysaccharide heptosyltransferase [Planctomycetota bacterium]